MFIVYAYRSSGTRAYDGKGSAWHTLEESYADRETALRRAQELVETGGYDTCSVKERGLRLVKS